MECYALELVHEVGVGGPRDDRAPMLLSVPRAYILTMHETETFPWLHGVARRTYVQRNRGFRACPKTRGDGRRVDATNQDLIHAYRAVFERERETTQIGQREETVVHAVGGEESTDGGDTLSRRGERPK